MFEVKPLPKQAVPGSASRGTSAICEIDLVDERWAEGSTTVAVPASTILPAFGPCRAPSR